jgi:hypothetical protein
MNKNYEESKKNGEIGAVIKYTENQGLTFNKSLLNEYLEEPADVIYNDKKYQIVSSNFKFEKEIRVNGEYHGGGSPEEVFDINIRQPLQKKKKYGDNAKGHILIIHSKSDPPIMYDYTNENFDIGFDEIYFVTSRKNLKLF